jgi:hypothetical protein
MKLEPDGVGGKGAAQQSRPLHRVLAFLDPLFGRAALSVALDDIEPGQLAAEQLLFSCSRLARLIVRPTGFELESIICCTIDFDVLMRFENNVQNQYLICHHRPWRNHH